MKCRKYKKYGKGEIYENQENKKTNHVPVCITLPGGNALPYILGGRAMVAWEAARL